MSGTLEFVTASTDTVFSANVANGSGGAVYLSIALFGPSFVNTSFLNNSAQIHGAVYATATGTAENRPTVFDGCTFMGNEAISRGGAVESAAGFEEFSGTTSEGNKADVGGALRLAGKASLSNCSFVGNVSKLAGGAAISNVGQIDDLWMIVFSANIYDCAPGMFLYYNAVSCVHPQSLSPSQSDAPPLFELLERSTTPSINADPFGKKFQYGKH